MKFGKVNHPEKIDFTLPGDHPDVAPLLSQHQDDEPAKIFVGCAKWNKKELPNFYPKGTKDELVYYSSQFNSIELNATFYRIFPAAVFAGWKNKTPDNFAFFPKMPQVITHRNRLKQTERQVDEFLSNASQLEHKLGMIFLQMVENYGPDKIADVVEFVRAWPKEFPLALELRHTEWFNDPVVASELYHLLEQHNVANVITDTAGRRDLLHMRLTTPYAFVRYCGANHSSDYTRLDDWVERLKQWVAQGIKGIYFFVHQNHEVESPMLAQYLIENVNKELNYDLAVPQTLQTSPAPQASLF